MGVATTGRPQTRQGCCGQSGPLAPIPGPH